MTISKYIKIAVFVPKTHANILRRTIGDCGGGKMGNYSYCSFSTEGTGRFKPLRGANPSIGSIGHMEEVAEEKIEFICPRKLAKKIINEIKKVHPYEEPAIDIYPLLTEEEI